MAALGALLQDPAIAPPPEEYVPPPEEAAAPPPQEAAPPVLDQVSEAPPPQAAPEQQAAPAQQSAAPPVLDEVSEPAPAAAPADTGGYTPAPPGPLQAAQSAIGNAVAPIAAQLPEGVRNVADAVGQPVGGAIDALTKAGGQLAEGDIPGAIEEAVLVPAGAPQQRMREQAGQRVAAGEGIEPTVQEVAQDPGNLLSLLPNVTLGTGLASAGGQNIDQWWETVPPEEQAALREAGGNAVVDAYKASFGVTSAPPAELSNPLDAAGTGGPLERAAGVLGAVPEMLGGYVESGKQGTLTPFIKDQLIEAAIDPLSFVPPAVGAKVAGTARGVAGGAVRKVPGVGPVIDNLAQKTPVEQARMEAEGITQAVDEATVARRAMLDDPAATAAAGGVPPGPTPLGTAAQAPPPGPATPPVAPSPTTVSDLPTIAQREVPNVGTIFDVRDPDGGILGQFRTREEAREFQLGRGNPTAGVDSPFFTAGTPTEGVGFPKYESVSPATGAPMRPRSEISGRPILERGARPALEAPLRKRLDTLGLTDVGIHLVNDLRDVNPNAGPLDQALYRSREKLVAISLDAARVDELPRLIDHEAVHALADLGLFRGNEFDTLVKAADQMGLREDVARRYPDAIPQRIAEELVAELYTRHRAGMAVPAPSRTLLQRIGDFFRQFGLAARDVFPADVLERIDNGEVGRRTRQQATEGADAMSRYQAPAFHGSKRGDLDTIWSQPDSKNFNTASRELGGFFTRSWTHAKHYAGESGTVYKADLGLANAYDMTRAEFDQLDTSWGPVAGNRGRMLRQQLMDAGHDGVIVWEGEPRVQPDGSIRSEDLQYINQMASFTDEAVAPIDATGARALRDASRKTDDAFARRQQAAAATGSAPEPIQRAAAEEPDPALTRYGVVTSNKAAKTLATPAAGKMTFADGYRPGNGLTIEDVWNQTHLDVEFWADPQVRSAATGNWDNRADAQKSRLWQDLDKRFNPDGTRNAADLSGPDRAAARDAFATDVLNEAITRALPTNTPKGRLGKINQTYLGAVRRMMLFNYLRVPSYLLQNLITNSINVGTRVGKGAVIDLWTSPREYGRAVKNQMSDGQFKTHLDNQLAQIGMGNLPNVKQTHGKYSLQSRMNKGVNRATRVIAPDWSVAIGNSVDQLSREMSASNLITRGFRDLNRKQVGTIRNELIKRGVDIPDTKIRQVVNDFQKANRTVYDQNAKGPSRNMLGKASTYEPQWNPDKFGKYLKDNLLTGMRETPDMAQFRNAIDRVTRDNKNAIRGILDDASTQVDNALFDWRSTNADELIGKVALFHYWQSRQGAFYVQEAMKRPGFLSAYGRMMEDFEQQATELDQPAWLKGFFQFQNSIGGFTTWFSPTDLVQSLLTFADWQMGEDAAEKKYKDLTALGEAWGRVPTLVHPLLTLVAYEIGAAGTGRLRPLRDRHGDLRGAGHRPTQPGQRRGQTARLGAGG